MSQKGSPKIVKIDLQPQTISVTKKHRRKIQVTRTKYTSPQDVRKLQKTFTQNKKQLLISKPKQNPLIESEVKPFEVKEFSFSEEKNGEFHKIQGKGYEIHWKEQHEDHSSLAKSLDRIGYIQLNVAIKIFQLCEKNYEYESLTVEDCFTLNKNISKSLKAIYGSKNTTLIMKKQSQIVESVKLVFYRKRSILIHELIIFLVDCNVMSKLIDCMLDIFPNQIKAF